MNPLWLLLIVPVCVSGGFVFGCAWVFDHAFDLGRSYEIEGQS